MAALKSAVEQGIDRTRVIVFSTPFVILLIIWFILSYAFFKNDVDYTYFVPLALTVAILIGVVIVNFPVYLGYEGYFPMRCLWVEDCEIYLGSFVSVFYFTGW